MSYRKGLHIIAEFTTLESAGLSDFTAFKALVENAISRYGLTKVGEVYHNFPGGGFTAVVCLTESHLSIHTWPESGMATFDVFLSNYLRDNEHTCRSLFKDVSEFYAPVTINKTELRR